MTSSLRHVHRIMTLNEVSLMRRGFTAAAVRASCSTLVARHQRLTCMPARWRSMNYLRCDMLLTVSFAVHAQSHTISWGVFHKRTNVHVRRNSALCNNYFSFYLPMRWHSQIDGMTITDFSYRNKDWKNMPEDKLNHAVGRSTNSFPTRSRKNVIGYATTPCWQQYRSTLVITTPVIT